jgi:REP element-mobilizing transposase RayT
MFVDPQMQLGFRPHGGRRKGAGRPPNGDEAMVSHLARPRFKKATPVHVTLRVNGSVPSLRGSRRFAIVRRCFADARGNLGLRLVEFSVLSNHLHLIVEADDNRALSRGMQGLNIRLAKALNKWLNRSGRVFADHYHSRLLLTPTEVANAIGYVLNNAAHHYGYAPGVDCCTSTSRELRLLLSFPIGWLLTSGVWRARNYALAALRGLPGW